MAAGSHILPLNYAMRVRFCNADLEHESDGALLGRTMAAMRSDPGFYLGTVANVSEKSCACLFNTAEVHPQRLVELKIAGGRVKVVPLNIVGTFPGDAAPLDESEHLLGRAIEAARWSALSNFEAHELVVVPKRRGGFSFAVVTLPATICDYPCYAARGVSHAQPIVAVSLVSERGEFKQLRKRVPAFFVGKLPASFQQCEAARNAARVLARKNAPPSSAAALAARLRVPPPPGANKRPPPQPVERADFGRRGPPGGPFNRR